MNLKNKSHNHHLMEQLLQSVSKNDALTVFFDRLWDDKRSYWKLFFTHLDILFPSVPIENVKFPIISWVSSNYTTDMDKPLETTAALSIARRDISVLSPGSIGSELTELFWSLTLFYLIKFCRANPDIQQLIDMEDFSFKSVREALSNKENINTDIFEELTPIRQLVGEEQIVASEATDMPTADPELASLITRLSQFFISLLAKPNEVTNIAQAFIWDTMIPLHHYFNQHLLNLLNMAGLSYKDYTNIMMEMFNLGLITTNHGTFWCKNEMHPPFILTSTSQIAPASQAIKCSTCGQKLILSILYILNPIIYDAIKFRDGLLAVALAQLFSKNDANYRFSYRANGGEIDFLCESPEGGIVFETKVHRPDVDERQLN